MFPPYQMISDVQVVLSVDPTLPLIHCKKTLMSFLSVTLCSSPAFIFHHSDFRACLYFCSILQASLYTSTAVNHVVSGHFGRTSLYDYIMFAERYFNGIIHNLLETSPALVFIIFPWLGQYVVHFLYQALRVAGVSQIICVKIDVFHSSFLIVVFLTLKITLDLNI